MIPLFSSHTHACTYKGRISGVIYSLAVRCYVLEDLVGIAAQVMAHGYHRGIHEADAAALAKATELHEEHHVEEHTGHEFYKAVIRNGIREIARGEKVTKKCLSAHLLERERELWLQFGLDNLTELLRCELYFLQSDHGVIIGNTENQRANGNRN